MFLVTLSDSLLALQDSSDCKKATLSLRACGDTYLARVKVKKKSGGFVVFECVDYSAVGAVVSAIDCAVKGFKSDV